MTGEEKWMETITAVNLNILKSVIIMLHETHKLFFSATLHKFIDALDYVKMCY